MKKYKYTHTHTRTHNELMYNGTLDTWGGGAPLISDLLLFSFLRVAGHRGGALDGVVLSQYGQHIVNFA